MTRTGCSRTRGALRIAGRAVLGFAVLEAVAIAVFRRQRTPAVDAVRRFNRWDLNPAMRAVAGRRYWYAAAVHHVGRSSGRPYVTPLLVARAGGRVYIPLPYGTGVDWCRNVLAAGRCTVEDHGRRYEVVEPEIVPAEVALPFLAARRRRHLLRVFAVRSFLSGRVVDRHVPAGGSAPGDSTTPVTPR